LRRGSMAELTLPYLTPDRALIFRVTHVANLPWILEHGLVCQNSEIRDPNFKRIGNADVIGKRQACPVPIPPGGMLADYVPFYFTPLSVTLFNIVTGYGGVERVPRGDLVILASSLHELARSGVRFVCTDRHALLRTARFSNSLSELGALIDWKRLQARDFKRDPENPEKLERYQAEALIHGSLPVHALTGLACSTSDQVAGFEAAVASRNLAIKVVAKPGWFFS